MKDENGKYYPNPEHLAKLKEGVEAWNKWREENPDIVPDLQGAHLERAGLYAAHLEGANLDGAHLEGAKLSRAHLEGAALMDAHLESADITWAHLEGAYLIDAHLEGADLMGANLEGAELTWAHLEGAKLGGAHIEGADLMGANLEGACLRYTELRNSDVTMVTYNRWTAFRGIRLEGSFGSPMFVRFAKDQDYIEELQETKLGRIACYIWFITCDCGRSITPWIAWCIAFVCLFAWKFVTIPEASFTLTNAGTLPWDYWTALYYSVVTFTTLGFGDITPATMEAAWWVMAEVILGYIMLGGLISFFSTKIARRS